MTKLKKFIKLEVILVILFTLSFLFRLWDITTQFEVWDETTVVRYGEEYLNFLRKGDFSKESWSLNKEHPPLSKYIFGATRIISLNSPYFRDKLDQEYPIGKRYTLQRIISALLGSITVVITYLLMRNFYNRKISFLGAMILSFTPYFIGHSKIATQENLVTFFITISVYLFILGLKSNNLKSKYFLYTGFVSGLALSTKYNAVFFLLYFAVCAVYIFKSKFLKNKLLIYKNNIILIPVITFLVLFMMWPWLWAGNPISQFLVSTGSRVGFTRIDKPSTEYFLGEYPHHSPWYYFIVYYIATTPPIILFGVMLFLSKIVSDLTTYYRSKKPLNYESNLHKFDILMLLFLITPMLATFSPLKMDGVRYIFPVLVPTAICAALGYSFLMNHINNLIETKYKVVFNNLIYMVVIGTLIFLNITLHPYYMDYYNNLVGGPKNVYEKRLFDFGYWGEGLREAVNFINANASPNSKVMIYAVPNHVLPDFRKDLIVIKNPPTNDVNYMLLNPTGQWILDAESKKSPFSKDYEYDQILELKTQDEAPIATVYEVKKKDRN